MANTSGGQAMVDLDDETDEELTEPRVKNGMPYNLIHKACYMNMLIYANDPYSVYKGTHTRKRHKYEFYRIPPLGMAPDWWERARKRWRPRADIFLAYCTIRFLTIIVIQIASYILSKQQIGMETFRKLKLFGKMVGNPMSEVPGISVMIYSTVLVNLFYLIGVTHRQYAKEPADLVAPRLIFDPHRDIRRMKLIIVRQLGQIRSLIEELLRNQINECPARSRDFARSLTINPTNLESLVEADEENSKVLGYIQLKAISALEKEISKMKPEAYSMNYCYRLSHEMNLIGLVVLIVSLPFYVFAYWSILSLALDSKCKKRAFAHGECKIFEVFSWADLFAFVEIMLAILLACYIVVVLFVTMNMHSLTQLVIVDGLKKDLKVCLDRLDWLNSKQKGSLIGDPTRVELEKSLLRTLTMVFIDYDEIKRIVCMVTRMMQDFMVPVIYGIIVAILASYADDRDLRRTLATFCTWLLLANNILFIYSASVYARTIKIERLAWSLLARLRERASKEGRAEDFISIMWRKLVLSHSLSDKQVSFSPFGVSLNYGKVMEMNFVFITLASLSRSI